jgi:HlyD family secretion protein
MKKTIIITALIVVLTSAGLILFVNLTSGRGMEMMNYTEAMSGTFEISVSNTGELVAENYIDIKGPDIVQNMNFRASNVKITDIVPEGTLVKKGDYVAALDRSSFSNTLKDEVEILKKYKTDLEMKILDTAVVLSALRDEIRNQQLIVEEASITVDQSRFEPPAVQRQSLLNLDREKRAYSQKQKLYSLRSAQNLSQIRNLKLFAQKQESKVNDLQNVLAGFTVTAPSDGMVIYKKDRLGAKIKAGSFLNNWDPSIATLPDLSSMLSKFYVSEIDVNKIKKGQTVQIAIDAFQGKSFTGKVSQIANIGEQLTNSDSKVFEVLVKIDGKDQGLRPAMTTSNKVITSFYNDVIYVSAESVHGGTDSIPYVYTKDGTRQVVVLGESNDKNIIIEKGLEEGTKLWLTTPENPDKFTLAGAELIPEIKEKVRARRLEMKTLRDDKVLLTRTENEPFTLRSVKSGAAGTSGSGSAGGN